VEVGRSRCVTGYEYCVGIVPGWGHRQRRGEESQGSEVVLKCNRRRSDEGEGKKEKVKENKLRGRKLKDTRTGQNEPRKHMEDEPKVKKRKNYGGRETAGRPRGRKSRNHDRVRILVG